MAWLISIIFISFPTNFFYIRHIQPYGISNLIGLYGILLFLRNLNKSTPIPIALFPALLGSIAFTMYPGAIIHTFVISILYIWDFLKDFKWNHPLKKLPIGLGILFAFLFPLVIFEALSLIGDQSYFASLILHQEIMTKGVFSDQENAAMFTLKYFFEVNSIPFILLCGLILLGLFIFKFKNLRKCVNYPINIILLGAVFYYFYYLYLSIVPKTAGFYGRIAYFYIPYLSLVVVPLIKYLPTWVSNIRFALMTLCLIGLIYFRFSLLKIAYPRDVLVSNKIWLESQTPLDVDYASRKKYPFLEDSTIITFQENKGYQCPSSPPLNKETGYPYVKQKNLVLINLLEFGPTPNKFIDFKPDNCMQLVFEKLHYLNLPIYYYEYGLKTNEIKWVQEKKVKIKIFKNHCKSNNY
jgi:hypothetical protein